MMKRSWIACPAAILLAALPVAGEVREERLDNGLRVLLVPVEGVPLVSVWSWIRSGSANERPGITGAAHWCEHMNFKGTQKYGRDDMKNLLERAGGMWNGYTWLDQTAYYETLPSAGLDLALDIEAQRMTSSLFLPEAVEAERTVIISELQMGENDPENLLDIETTAVAFRAHPYRWPTIGWQSDVEGMTRDDLYGFYRRYYIPNNATLVVAGVFDEDETMEKVREKFGPIPRGPEVGRLRTREPEQDGERRLKVERAGETAYLQLIYHTPTVDSDDFPALTALNTLLGGAESMNLSGVEWRGQASRSSRLYRRLVDAKLAAKAGSLYLPTKYPCMLCVYATAAPGVDLARLERGVIETLEEVKAGPIPESEFQKVITQMRARLVYDGEGVTGLAQTLGFFDTVGGYRLSQTLLSGIGKIGKEDIISAARRYLTERNRTVGWYVPMPSASGEGKASGGKSPGRSAAVARYREGKPSSDESPHTFGERMLSLMPWTRRPRIPSGGAPAWSRVSVRLPWQPILSTRRKELPNGLTLIVRENRSSPSIALRADIAAGSAYDPSGKHGIANFTAAMLDRGSAGMSAQLIADALDSSGTELSVSCGRDRASVTAQMLSEKLPLVLEVLAQILREPVFAEEELEKVRGRLLTAITEASRDTQRVAEDRAYEAIYPPGHPYRHRVEGDVESVSAMGRRDLLEFYNARYGPQVTTIVLSGDVSAVKAEPLVEKFFGSWVRGRPISGPTILTPPLPVRTTRDKVYVPDKTQVDIAVGCRGIARGNPDYYAAHVMNTILGRFGMGGRLGRAIREDRGLAYYAYSTFVPYRHVGPFLVRAGVNPANVAKTIDAICETIRAMMEKGPTAKELEESKDFIVRSIPRELETNAAAAAALADMEFYGLGLDYFDRLPALIDNVTAKDVRRVAREYLHPDNAAVILAGPVN